MSHEELKAKAAKVVAEAAAVMERVYKEVPEKYRIFIDRLEQGKKVKLGDRETRVSFEVPYIGVDGRVQMCEDEHRMAGKDYSMATEFVVVGESLLCKCAVTSPIFGLRTGHAIVPLGKTGYTPEATNPFEVAETSAIGRALGFAGYGLLGTGIASLEEVRTAMERSEKKGKPGSGKKSDPEKKSEPEKKSPPSSPEEMPDRLKGSTPPAEGEEPFPEEDTRSAAEKAEADPLMGAVKETFPEAGEPEIRDPKTGRKDGPITNPQKGLVRRRLKAKGISDDAAVEAKVKELAGCGLGSVKKSQLDKLLAKIQEVA